MKRFVIALTTLALIVSGGMVPSAFAATQYELVFQWDQDDATVTAPNFKGWHIYMSTASGTGYEQVLEVPYQGTPLGTYEAALPTADLPKDVPLYFVATSFDVYGQNSGHSNEISRAVPSGTPPLPPDPPMLESFRCFIRVVPVPTP